MSRGAGAKWLALATLLLVTKSSHAALKGCDDGVMLEACVRIKEVQSRQNTCTVQNVVDCCNGECGENALDESRPDCNQEFLDDDTTTPTEFGPLAGPGGKCSSYSKSAWTHDHKISSTVWSADSPQPYSAEDGGTKGPYWWGTKGSEDLAPGYFVYGSSGCKPDSNIYMADSYDHTSPSKSYKKCDIIMWALAACYDETLTGYEAIAQLETDCEAVDTDSYASANADAVEYYKMSNFVKVATSAASDQLTTDIGLDPFDSPNAVPTVDNGQLALRKTNQGQLAPRQVGEANLMQLGNPKKLKYRPFQPTYSIRKTH